MPGVALLLCHNSMRSLIRWSDPLSLSAGTGARLVLAAAVSVLLWLGVLWAMAGL